MDLAVAERLHDLRQADDGARDANLLLSHASVPSEEPTEIFT